MGNLVNLLTIVRRLEVEDIFLFFTFFISTFLFAPLSMKRPVHLLQLFIGDVSIDLRGGNIAVA